MNFITLCLARGRFDFELQEPDVRDAGIMSSYLIYLLAVLPVPNDKPPVLRGAGDILVAHGDYHVLNDLLVTMQ